MLFFGACFDSIPRLAYSELYFCSLRPKASWRVYVLDREGSEQTFTQEALCRCLRAVPACSADVSRISHRD